MLDKSQDRSIDPDWYTRSFGDFYKVLYAHRTIEAAAPEAEFASRVLSISGQDRLLDLCCGNGRHLHHLSRYAKMCVGFDYSPELLVRAKELLTDAAALVRGDMRALPFDSAFDCLTSFFTSFGYFQSDDDNARVAKEMRRALKAGGRFLVDHANASEVRTNLEQYSEQYHGDLEIRSHRWIDEERSRVNKDIAIVKNGLMIAEFQESVRLYFPEEMRQVLGNANLVVTDVYGDWSGAPFNGNSPRMIAIGFAA